MLVIEFFSHAMDRHAFELLCDILKIQEDIGRVQAELNWAGCSDIDGKTAMYKEILHRKCAMEKHATLLMNNLDLMLSDEEMEIVATECASTMRESAALCEADIELRYRPTSVYYNKKALFIKTRVPIPEDIQIGLSFGHKFLFPYVSDNSNIHRVLALVDKCIEECVSESQQCEASVEIGRLLSKRNGNQRDGVIQWLCFVAKRTEKFFHHNQQLFAVRSDKGGHTVIVETDEYDSAVRGMLDDDAYQILNSGINPLDKLVSREAKLIGILQKNHLTKHIAPAFYEPNVKQLAKFYGLPKIHKPGFRLRPIVSMHGAPGSISGKCFNEMLKALFPVRSHHVKDSYDIKNFLDDAHVDEDDVLVSFDVVSMYTSIPKNFVKEIIMQRYQLFFTVFGIGRRILIEFLDFLLNDSVVFTALDETYIQVAGLPMGGSVSPTLARIVMDCVVDGLLLRVPQCTFIKVFVDDTLAAVKKTKISDALTALNEFHSSMKFTAETEDKNKSINFLNLTVIRDGNSILTNWYKKSFASGRLLNFHSAHKKATIIETARAFIHTVIKLSDPTFFHDNKDKITDTLRENSFPESLIEILLNNNYTYMRQPCKKRVSSATSDENSYRIFPHSIYQSREIKRVIHRLCMPGITLAESTRNTKVNFITTRKTYTPWVNKSNVIIISNCVCKRKFRVERTRFNETGLMASRRIITLHNECMGNIHAFKKVKFQSGFCYHGENEYLLKYLKGKYLNAVVDQQGGLPNFYFRKLLKFKKRTN